MWREPERPVAKEPERIAPTKTKAIFVARPDVAAFASMIPDPEHDLRWPLSLTVHPTLEPAFAIAPALAEPGLGWTDLCRLGGMNRYGGNKLRDLTTYLRAWCTVAAGDRDGGLAKLVTLLSSVTPQLGPAVRMDIVSVLAAGTADEAERLMAKHKLFNLERLDLLAGTFVELGKPDDAYAINHRALQSDRVASHANSCRRLARALVLGPADLRDAPLELLRVHARQDTPEPVCVELHRDLSCWEFLTRATINSITGQMAFHCGPYWKEHNVPVQQQALLEALAAWPKAPAHAHTWYLVGEHAAMALTLDGADELAVRALEAVLESDSCKGPSSDDARKLAHRIYREPQRKRSVDDARLIRLIYNPRELCVSK